MTSSNPTAVRRQLGRRLRSLRESVGKTREDVVAARLMSRSKLENVEFGRVSVRPGDVYELCRLYGTAPEAMEELRELALASDRDAWWQEYGENLSRGYNTYLGLEDAAVACWAYQPAVVDGLLQTRSYALEVERTTALGAPEDHVVEASALVRLDRQRRVFERAVPLRLSVVMGESALRQRLCGAGVMAEQLQVLKDLASRPYLDIRVLTDAAGPHVGYLGGFRILDFADADDPAVVYTQSYAFARYNDRAEHVAQHRQIFRQLEQMSTPVEEFLG